MVPTWAELAAELDWVMMPEEQIAKHHALWHAPGADRARLAVAIRADIEQRRPKADDIAKRIMLIQQASRKLTPQELRGDPESVVRKLKDMAGLDNLPKPEEPSRH